MEVESFGQYAVDGVIGADLTDPSVTLAGFPINHTVPSSKEHVFEIAISPIETIHVKAFKDIVSVMIRGATESNFHNSVGIMGSYTAAGAMLARDQTTTIEDPVMFGKEWQGKILFPFLSLCLSCQGTHRYCISFLAFRIFSPR